MELSVIKGSNKSYKVKSQYREINLDGGKSIIISFEDIFWKD
jgi:hypothetical protein